MYINLVLGGGGVTGLLYVGLFEALEEKGYFDTHDEHHDEHEHDDEDIPSSGIKNISSVSAGAGVALLYLLTGKNSNKLRTYFMELDFRHIFFKDPFTKLFDYGLLDSARFLDIGKNVLEKENLSPNITFQELYEYTHINFNVLVTNISTGKSRYFSHTTDPNVEVLPMSKCLWQFL